jgi:hypothetical protein
MVLLGFPFETLLHRTDRDVLMKAMLRFLAR